LYAGGPQNNLNNNIEIDRAYIYYNKLNSLYKKYVKDEDLNPAFAGKGQIMMKLLWMRFY
jgi:hypothetical protein